jgi:nifR3 family TIM-barrel protein
MKIGSIELPEFPLLLAPMEDVSDPPFRRLCKLHGADLMYTEFISSEGLIRHADKSIMKLDIFDYEKPIGIQIFGGNGESMGEATRIVTAANPDLVDINYGCPVKKVVCKDAGAGILKNIPKMIRLTEEVIKNTHLPVTVKTRLGWDESTKNIVEIAERLQDIGVQALSVHGRTRVQMYKGEADWTLIGKIKENPRMHIPIFGNGDVDSPEKARLMRDTYGVDGIMIGRASIGYPWIFREVKHYLATGKHLAAPTLEDRVQACREHLEFSVQWKGNVLGILEMRRHYTNYFRGMPNVKEFRRILTSSNDLDELFATLAEIQTAYAGFDFGLAEVE